MKRKLLLIVPLLIFMIGGVGLRATGHAAAATHSRKICSTNIAAGQARCTVLVLTNNSGVAPYATGTPQGYGPGSFRAAYHSGNANNSIGIVIAYDAPNILKDVNTYSKVFNLSALPACTSAVQKTCLNKVNQHGSDVLPAINSSWAVETSLDGEAAHGLCPECRINLVEAATPSLTNLGEAANEAVALGSKVVSNSYGGPESSAETKDDKYYHHSGVLMVASSGDSGYGTSYPAASPYVLAVGGTSLHMTNGRVQRETAWSGAGSGCSQFEVKPAWQSDKGCAGRSIADISADADPATGAAIYDSLPSDGQSGWFTVGGTSLASPIVAGLIASSPSPITDPDYIYRLLPIRDVTKGSNGNCSITYLCTAGKGYDGPTGLGVPNQL